MDCGPVVWLAVKGQLGRRRSELESSLKGIELKSYTETFVLSLIGGRALFDCWGREVA